MGKREQKKKILFLTGTRADFGKLKPLMTRVERSRRFHCYVFATGMHTMSRYGFTYDEIRKTGFRNLYLFMNQSASESMDMDLVLANTIEGLGRYVREYRPDLLVVHGDRVEALAGAIVGALNNILVAHIEGGELSGTVDELIRHAVTKLSRIHFVANRQARRRLIQLGEDPDCVLVIGSPEVDIMLSDRLPTLEQAKRRYRIRFNEYAVFAYHPVTTELEGIAERAGNVARALIESGLNFVVVHPNNDAGSDLVRRSFRRMKKLDRFRFFPSIRFEYFLTLIKHCRLVIGNSSAGVREAPVYGIPSINLGSRQSGRFEHESIVSVPEQTQAILGAIAAAPAGNRPSLHFGKGNSAQLFMEALKDEAMWNIDPQKQFKDLTDEAIIALNGKND